uniref:extracellular solute-binding protein n=1 Tax=Enterocloster clostridioformis TaxID=1531 RepID=UPI0025A53F8D|nr:extracellular solute-binding protein [Enterocloster clostridioformis]
MGKKNIKILLSLFIVLLLSLSACSPAVEKSETGDDSRALTWIYQDSYAVFLELLGESCPDIELETLSFAGANVTGYSWAQMRADDIADIYNTSQILDEDLASQRLADLSAYDFINRLPTSVLNQVSIDGGVYLLPVAYNMFGIYYNQTLMEEKGWELPANFSELETLCGEIRAEGLTPGYIPADLTGHAFSGVLNLAKTDWLTTPAGAVWERDFLAGNAAAAGQWE